MLNICWICAFFVISLRNTSYTHLIYFEVLCFNARLIFPVVARDPVGCFVRQNDRPHHDPSERS